MTCFKPHGQLVAVQGSEPPAPSSLQRAAWSSRESLLPPPLRLRKLTPRSVQLVFAALPCWSAFLISFPEPEVGHYHNEITNILNIKNTTLRNKVCVPRLLLFTNTHHSTCFFFFFFKHHFDGQDTRCHILFLRASPFECLILTALIWHSSVNQAQQTILDSP